MRLDYVSRQLGYELSGDPAKEVNGIAWPVVAEIDQIAIINKQKEIKDTDAQVVLTVPGVVCHDKMMLYCTPSVSEAAVKIALLFIAHGVYPDYSQSVALKFSSKMIGMGKDCRIGNNVTIGAFSTLGNEVIVGDNCNIGNNVDIGSNTIIGDNVTIRDGAKIAAAPFFQYRRKICSNFAGIGQVIICDGAYIGNNSIIQRGTFSDTIIGPSSSIGDLVVIGHDVCIGEHSLVVTQSGVGGRAILDDWSTIYAQCGVNENVVVAKYSVLKAGTRVIKNVRENQIVSGYFGRDDSRELKINASLNRMIREDRHGRML